MSGVGASHDRPCIVAAVGHGERLRALRAVASSPCLEGRTSRPARRGLSAERHAALFAEPSSFAGDTAAQLPLNRGASMGCKSRTEVLPHGVPLDALRRGPQWPARSVADLSHRAPSGTREGVSGAGLGVATPWASVHSPARASLPADDASSVVAARKPAPWVPNSPCPPRPARSSMGVRSGGSLRRGCRFP